MSTAWDKAADETGSGGDGSCEEHDRRERAAARANWSVRKFKLGEEPSDDLSAVTTAEERIAMMWPLTVEAWTLAGREISNVPRDQWPVKILRPEWMQGEEE